MNLSEFVESMEMGGLHELLSDKERTEMLKMDEEFEVIKEIPTDELFNHLCTADRHVLDLLTWDITDDDSGLYMVEPHEFVRRLLLSTIILMREVLDATD